MIVAIIVIIILFLLAVGFIALLSVRKDFIRESEYLNALEGELQNQSNAITLYQSVKISALIPHNSIVSERVEIIFKLSEKSIPPNLSDISELTVSAKEASHQNQLSNFVLSTLLIIGLGGTFLAFKDILANSRLTDAISNGAIDMIKYQEALDRIYTGFNSAFLASVCGIFGTVFLLFVRNVVVNSTRERFFNRLDFVTQSELIPVFSSLYKRPEELLSKTAKKLDELITSFQPVSQNLNSSAVNAANAVMVLGQFADVLINSTERFLSFTSPTSPLITAIDQLFNAIQKSESRYHQYQQAFTTLIDQVQNQNARLAETQLKFVELHNVLETLHDQFSVDFEQLNKKYQDEIAAISRTFGVEVKGIIQNTSDVLDEAQKLITNLNSQQNAYSQNFKSATEKLDSAMTKIEAAIKQLDTSMNKIDSPAQKVLARLDGLQKLGEIETALKGLPRNEYTINLDKLLNSTLEVRNMLKNIEVTLKEKNNLRADIEAIQRTLRAINQTLERKRSKFSVFGWRP